MSNKFVKISIILIFMLFVTGLFNFCFAYEFDINQFNIEYTFDLQRDTYIGTYDVDFDRMTSDNVINQDSEFSNAPTIENIENYTKIYVINFDNNNLYCVVLPSISGDLSEGYYTEIYQTSTDGNGIFQLGLDGGYFYNYVYDFESKSWEWKSKSTIMTYSNYLFAIDNELKIYDDVTNKNLLFDSANFDDTIPTDEELITGCDFKVKMLFTPQEEDLPNLTKYYTRSTSFRVLIQHSLSNWNYYDVYLDIELSKYNNYWLNNFYYDWYGIDDEFKVKEKKITQKETLLISEGDYFTIFSGWNDSDIVQLTYTVYKENSTDLLLKRVIKFNFDKGNVWDLTSTSTGNIISDKIYDSSNSEINVENSDLTSNGNILNTVPNLYDFSTYYNLDSDDLTNNVTDMINNSKNFFSILTMILLLLPPWISSLIFMFFTGLIVITLFRFIRGA